MTIYRTPLSYQIVHKRTLFFEPLTGTETTGLNGSNFLCLGSLTILSNSKYTANGLWFSWPQNIFLIGPATPFFFFLSSLHSVKRGKRKKGVAGVAVSPLQRDPAVLKNKFTKMSRIWTPLGALSNWLIHKELLFVVKAVSKRPTAAHHRVSVLQLSSRK